MRPPVIRRLHPHQGRRHRERGVTILLVAVAMIAILAIAALSIDVITLYLAKEEQRSADVPRSPQPESFRSAASLEIRTTSRNFAVAPWQAACDLATQTAQAVANQNVIGGTVANSVTVTFLYNGVTADCTAPSVSFTINSQVQVKVVRARATQLFFSHLESGGKQRERYGNRCEAFNPSNSGSVSATGIVTVSPRCVKPWIVPNRDPNNAGAPLVSRLMDLSRTRVSSKAEAA